MSDEIYDIVIIGSGPGGYVSAIRSSQLGLKTAIIEKNNNLGGTCLNTGCIPSKCLLDSTKYFFLSKKIFKKHGIFFKDLYYDFIKMMDRKDKIINNINNGIKYLMKKNKIDVYKGIGQFKGKNTLSILNESSFIEKKNIKFKNCIISTGSKPLKLDNINFEKRIISSTELLNIKEIPNNLLIIGGGVIGIELGSIFNRLGTKVSIIDNTDTIISNMDISIINEIKKILNKYSIDIYTSLYVKSIINSDDEDNVLLSCKNSFGDIISLKGDYCLVSIGRKPQTKHLDIDKIGIKHDKNGFIIVDNYLKTTVNNIYAIGDVIGGKMLAHKAEEEGLYVVENIIGKKPSLPNYNIIPSIIYSYPEIASVGYTEDEVKRKKIEYNKGIFPMKALGRAISSGCTEGFLKMISNKNTDEILGVHIVGEHASEMIMEAAVAMEFRASSEDIYRICHPHPTFSESFKESALLNFENKSIHI